MNPIRAAVAAAVLVGLGAGGYTVYRYERVDRPAYPLPPDDPRCPPHMAYIPAGNGRIYVDPDADHDEPTIVENMHIDAFCLDRNEVTAGDYEKCVHSGACTVPSDLTDKHGNYGVPERAFHPINDITWTQAVAFCKVQGKRLPLEQEWEFAAQGGAAKNRYPWGDDPTWTGRICPPNMFQGTCVVRSSPPESFGLFDMAANVSEFTAHACSSDSPCNVQQKIPYSGASRAEDPNQRGQPWGWTNPHDPLNAHTRMHMRSSGSFWTLGMRCAQ